MNRKGLINEIYIIIVLFIVMLVIICGFWIAATAGPLVIGEGKHLTSEIQKASNTLDTGNGSLNNATTIAVNTTDSILGVVDFIVYAFFLGFIIGFVAVCYYVRSYKWLAVVWICLIIAAVFISFIVSNASTI